MTSLHSEDEKISPHDWVANEYYRTPEGPTFLEEEMVYEIIDFYTY
jgi:hypothetical protein